MNILVLGSGGREHALAWKIAQDAKVQKVFVAPGNAGTETENKCENVALDILDNAAIIAFAKENNVDLVIVGPEAPLVNGVVDAARAAGVKIWGPTQYAAQLEGSKAFAKHFLKRHNIPTAFYDVFTEVDAAKAYIEKNGAPIVIKADGLAAGKGVIVAMTNQEAFDAIDDMLAGNKFGDAGSRVVIEQFLDGEEASFICMIDGENILPMATSQDHKRIFEADQGPNTGGMGAYSPAPVVTNDVFERVMNEVMRPTVEGMAKDGHVYTGFLYAGLMIDAEGQPRVIEFNCRFGDPETQPIMMRLQSSLVDLVEAGIEGKLPSEANWDERKTVGIVLASAGYPETAKKGDVISGLDTQIADSKVFHAGTAKNAQGEIVTSGGRVLCVTALGNTIGEAQAKALELAEKVTFDGVQYRKDIGYRAIARENA
ncbi:phosphoribosylamine--glycine ligase [Acinetobacter gerneri]|jgi:phosphoribosylamine--glycine ligase|uniref:Phosphoribosylamine--glycine ligase n=2 Tax=Acinetobacter gerneri TaxID=202952 RepID=N8Y816_9GAMM|nr:phosphoribosylamine--glycine ligase [Acinetobacter gerneri]ENV32907.1 phosphoribosylamine-glycine ligase [Acinetobacter gerneri DSM 14967 = CIP 107464 = MTCC 9824]EPR85360.1 Phosphoribosylamine--glycine ligase [Acinetobacter gerneri DSM 14967 = CIP 107464 = MTCC 9824]MCH4242899.1 phosphoribosylamine--glycine ligase [Acinetobacter gerneri]MDQ9008147.1 phosphoribosylamine--glycine ligase [Acinetobacter gerneri]MDQ9012439.1 phosphoribosylamine--glycine ligase [Acinetobacter gerneri]